MTPEYIDSVVLSLGVIMSYGLGGLCGIAFVIASAIRFD